MSKRGASVSSAHPCHNLSNPVAQIFMCRHCMAKFYDPIQRWRHSKTCKKGSTTSNPPQDFVNKTGKRPIYSNCAVPEIHKTPPKEPVPVKKKKADKLSCLICKKVFTSLEEMKEHVKKACNKPSVSTRNVPGPPTQGDIILNEMYLSPQLSQFEKQLEKIKDSSSHGEEVVTNQIESLLKAAQALHQQQQKQQVKYNRLSPDLASEETVQNQLKHKGRSKPSSNGKGGNGYLKYAVLDVRPDDLPSASQLGDLEKGMKRVEQVTTIPTSPLSIPAGYSSGIPGEIQDNSPYSNPVIEIHVPAEGAFSSPVNPNINGACPQQVYEVHISRDDFLSQQVVPQSVTMGTVHNKSISQNSEMVQSQSSGARVEAMEEPDVFDLISQVIGEDLDQPRSDEQNCSLQNPDIIVKQDENRNHSADVTNKTRISDCDHTSAAPATTLPVLDVTESLLPNKFSLSSSVASQDSQTHVLNVNQNMSSQQISSRILVESEGLDCTSESLENTSDSHINDGNSTIVVQSPELIEVIVTQHQLPDESVNQNQINQSEDQGIMTGADAVKAKISSDAANFAFSGCSATSDMGLDKSSAVTGDKSLDVSDQSTCLNQNVMDEIDGDQSNNHKAESLPERIKKPKVPRVPKCRVCDKVFKSVELLRKHNKVPCKIRLTRNLTQKVLRPKRIMKEVPNMSKHKKKKQTKPLIEKPKLLAFSDRKFSDLSIDPNKNKKGKSKTKRKTMTEYNFCITSKKELRNSKVDVRIDYTTLPEKEQYFFHLGLVSITQLTSDHRVNGLIEMSSDRGGEFEVMEDRVVIDKSELLPPVLEKELEVAGQLGGDIYILSDKGFENIDPPVLHAINDDKNVDIVCMVEEHDDRKCSDTVHLNLGELSEDLTGSNCVRESESDTFDNVAKHYVCTLEQCTKKSKNRSGSQEVSCTCGDMLTGLSHENSPVKLLTERHFTDAIDVSQGTFVGEENVELLCKSTINSSDAVEETAIGSTASKSSYSVTVGLQTDIPSETDKIMYPRAAFHQRFLKKMEAFNRENAKGCVDGKSDSCFSKDKEARKNLFESLTCTSIDGGPCNNLHNKNSVSPADGSSNLKDPSNKNENLFDRLNNAFEASRPKVAKTLTEKGNTTSQKPLEEVVVYPKTPILQERNEIESEEPKRNLDIFKCNDPVLEAFGEEDDEPCVTRKPCDDIETVSYQNGKNLLDLIAKTLGIFPSSNSQDASGDLINESSSNSQTSTVSNGAGLQSQNSNDLGGTGMYQGTGSNSNGDVQIIIMNNSSNSESYTMGIDVINLPTNIDKKEKNHHLHFEDAEADDDKSPEQNSTQTFGNSTQTFGNSTQTFGNSTQTFGNSTQTFGNSTRTYVEDKLLLDGFSEKLSKFVSVPHEEETELSESGQSVVRHPHNDSQLLSRSCDQVVSDDVYHSLEKKKEKLSVLAGLGQAEWGNLDSQKVNRTSEYNNKDISNDCPELNCSKLSYISKRMSSENDVSRQMEDLQQKNSPCSELAQSDLVPTVDTYSGVEDVQDSRTSQHLLGDHPKVIQQGFIDNIPDEIDPKYNDYNNYDFNNTLESNKESGSIRFRLAESGDSLLSSISTNVSETLTHIHQNNEQQNEDNFMKPAETNTTSDLYQVSNQSSPPLVIPQDNGLGAQDLQMSTVEEEPKVMVQYVEQMENDPNVSYVVIDNGIEICRTESGMEDTMYDDSEDDEPYLKNSPFLSEDDQMVFSETVST